ncbi:hypothetical protein PVAG01_09416 [Phlyctema vagabunda]|uniref:Uncharacterized protein n=1 Tax=Phlyctema vagabunda TaxID=108571 RepID=A0ABR4P7B5_9HELO
MIRDKRSRDGQVASLDDQASQDQDQTATLRARHRRFFKGRQRKESRSLKAEGLDERAEDLTDEVDSPSSADESDQETSVSRPGFSPTTRQTISSATALPAPTFISVSPVVVMPTLTLNTQVVASISSASRLPSTVLSTTAIAAPASPVRALPVAQSSLPSTLTTAVIVAAPAQSSLLSSIPIGSSINPTAVFLTSTTAAVGFPLITPGSLTQDATRTEQAKKESKVEGGLIAGALFALVALIAVFVVISIASKRKAKEAEAHKGDAEKHGPPGSGPPPPVNGPPANLPSTAPPTAPPSGPPTAPSTLLRGAIGSRRNTNFTPPPYWPMPAGMNDPSIQKNPISTGTSTPNPAFAPSQLPLVPAPLQNVPGGQMMQQMPNQSGGGQGGYFNQANTPVTMNQQAQMYRPAPPPPMQVQPAATRNLMAQQPPIPAGGQDNPNLQQGAQKAAVPPTLYAPYRAPFVESVPPEQNQPQPQQQQQQRQGYGEPGPVYLSPNQEPPGQGRRGPNYPRESNFSISRYLDEDRPPLPQTTYIPR